MIAAAALQTLIQRDDGLSYSDTDSRVGIGRALIDGALVIYDLGDPPHWLPPRDEDGNSRKPLPEAARP